MRVSSPAVACLIWVVACGGTTTPTTSTHDAGSSGRHDSGAPPEDAGCVAHPVEGEPCASNPRACNPGNLCCSGEWVCSASSGTWTLEEGSCPCAVDAGVAPVDAAAPPDTGMFKCGDLTCFSCGTATCTSGDVCVASTTTGGACEMPGDGGTCPNGMTVPPDECCDNSSTSYACQRLPVACGGAATCECAASLCVDGARCTGVAGTTLACELDAP